MSVQLVPNMHVQFLFDKITDNVHEFGIQLKESLLAEFDNDDAITSEDEALVLNDTGHFWSRFGSGATTLLGQKYACFP